MKRRNFIKSIGAVGLGTFALPQEVFASRKEDKIKSKNIPVKDGWDVIVVGGGPSGCAAAIAAAREGSKTLLIESSGALGGVGTSGLLNAWCPFSDGKEIIYKGIAEKIFLESKKGVPHATGDNWIPINSEYLKRVYDDFVIGAGVHVLFFSTMASVEMKDDNTVEAIVVANKAGLTAYKAKVFIDCTGDGDLATWAGADFRMGDDEGVSQAGSLCFTLINVNDDKYRSVHSSSSASPIHKMVGNPDYPLVTEAHMNDKVIAPGYIGFNAGHVAVDSTDPESLTQAMIRGRKLAAELHRGLKEFDSDAFGSSVLSSTAAMMGIRESRRIVCDYTFTLQDWVDRKEFEDNIGRNCYYIDVHKEGAAQYSRYKAGESHGIPFRCLLPRGLKNVLVAGRCISTDHYALGSLRVMPPAMVTGEAAGVAASISLRQARTDIHSIDVSVLRKRLVELGQRID